MSTDFPTGLDSYTRPAATDPMDSPSHSGAHANVYDAVEALEAKVGIDGSAVLTSLDYLLKNSASVDPGHLHTSASISGVISVAQGGTGAASLTDGGVLLGSGTGAVTAMAVLADGEMIVGNGATDPVAESGATLRTSIGVGAGDSPTFTGLTLSVLTFNGATGVNLFNLPDNLADALSVKRGSDDWIVFDSRNGVEQITITANKSNTYDLMILATGAGPPGLMFYAGDAAGDNYVSMGQSTLVGNIPFFLEIGSTSGEDGPLLSLFNEVDNLQIFYEGHVTPSPTNTWIFQTDVDTIRLAPGNKIFQVQGKFQIGGDGFTRIGGTQGFVEWFHDGTDGFITSSLGKIFIPQLDLGGASLGSFGDSATEIDVRRTVSDLDNTNVTGTGLIQIGGDGSFATDLTYKIEITTGGAIGTAIFRWSDDGGATWDEENITTSFSPHTMNNGLKVWFTKGTGTSFNTSDFATITAIGTNNQKKTLQVDTRNNKTVLDGNLVPLTDSDIDLGTPSIRWANAYIDLLDVTTLDINMTQGSVLFINSSGQIAQDNANFFWDDSNNRLGLGTATPVAPLEIQSLAASMRQTRYSDTAVQSAGLTVQRSRGTTVGTDVVVQDGDRIANFNLRGYDGATYRTAASIQAFIDGTPGLGDMPGRLIFLTTADGASSATERMRIDNAGNVGIGTTNSDSPLHIVETYLGTLINQTLNIDKTVLTSSSGDFFTSQALDIDMEVVHQLTGIDIDNSLTNRAGAFTLTESGSHSIELQDGAVTNEGIRADVKTTGTLTGAQFQALSHGGRFTVINQRQWNNASGVYTQSLFGVSSQVTDSTAPTSFSSLTRNLYGFHTQISGNSSGTVKSYGYYVESVSGGTSYNFYGKGDDFSYNRGNLGINVDPPVAMVDILNDTAAQIAFQLKGAALQSADFLKIIDENDAEVFSIGVSDTVINDVQADRDFRVAGESISHVLFVNAGVETVTIGSVNSLAHFGIDGHSDEIQFLIEGHSAQTNFLMVARKSDGVTQVFTINNDGEIAVGALTPSLGTIHISDTKDPLADLNDPNDYSLVLHRFANNNQSGVGIGFASTTVTNSIGGAIIYRRTSSSSQGQMEFYTKLSAASGIDPVLNLTIQNDGDLVIGSGVAGKDYSLTFDGESNNGSITWLEDEREFQFSLIKGLIISTNAVPGGIEIDNIATNADPELSFSLSGTKTFVLGIDDTDADKFKIDTTALGVTDAFVLDSSQNIGLGGTSAGAKLDVTGNVVIDGDADEIQFIVQGHSTQTNFLAVFEQSDGTDAFTFSNAGDFISTGDIKAGNTVAGSDPKSIFVRRGDANFHRFEGSPTTANDLDIVAVGATADINIITNTSSIRMNIDGATGNITMAAALEIDGDLNHDGSNVGFYGTAVVALQTGVAVTAAGVHTALVNLGLITA